MEMTFNDIKDNKPLFEFCKKIWGYKKALECDMRYLFLVSLISSDKLINKEECIDSVNRINFILDNIELFDLKDELKEETMKFLNDGLNIIKRELTELMEPEKNKRDKLS